MQVTYSKANESQKLSVKHSVCCLDPHRVPGKAMVSLYQCPCHVLTVVEEKPTHISMLTLSSTPDVFNRNKNNSN